MKKLIFILFLLPFLAHSQGGIWKFTNQQPASGPLVVISRTFFPNFSTGAAASASQGMTVTFTNTGTTGFVNTIPTWIEGSNDGGSTWHASFSGLSVGTDSFYFRVKASVTPGTYGPSNITFGGSGATSATCSVTATVTSSGSPTNTVFPTSLSLSTVTGTNSTVLNSQLTGVNLTGADTVKIPASFLGSPDGINWFSNFILQQTGGGVNNLIYVMIPSSVAPGSYSGSITITSPGATPDTLTVNGTVSSSGSPTDSIVGLFYFSTSLTGVSALWTPVNGTPNTGTITATDMNSNYMHTTFVSYPGGFLNVSGSSSSTNINAYGSTTLTYGLNNTSYPSGVVQAYWYNRVSPMGAWVVADSGGYFGNLDTTQLYTIDIYGSRNTTPHSMVVHLDDSTNHHHDSCVFDAGNNYQFHTGGTLKNIRTNSKGRIYYFISPNYANPSSNLFGYLTTAVITKQATRESMSDPLMLGLIISVIVSMFKKKKRTVSALALLLFFSSANAQSETNDFITYDTTIAAIGRGGQGGGGNTWLVRVWRPRNYFTAGNADTASRVAILSFPGSGQVQTGQPSDSNFLFAYGPHYYLKNGWDGSVTTGNGKHYPIYITVSPFGQNLRPWYTQSLIDTLIKIFHPRGKIGCMGFSEGVWLFEEALQYAQFAGDEHEMPKIGSIVSLEGESSSNIYGFELSPWQLNYGHWAAKYNGKSLSLEGTSDSRSLWILANSMNDSAAGSAYFAYQNIGGGVHCCWNSMYDPSATNWQCITPLGPNLVINTLHANSMGTYKTGDNIITWTYKQLDTTLVGSGAPTVTTPGNQIIQLPVNSISLTGTATASSGKTISSTTWSQTSGPSTASISGGSTLSVTFGTLVAGIYIFKLTAIDNAGGTSNSTTTVTVLAEQSPTVSAGPPQTLTQPISSTTLTGTALGNGGAVIDSTQTIWSQLSGPVTAAIISNDSFSTSVTGMTNVGSYIFKLTSTDNNGNSSSSTVTVTIQATGTPAVKPAYIIGCGEYIVTIMDSTGKFVYSVSTNLTISGVNNTGLTGIPLLVVATPYPTGWGTVNGSLHGGAAVDNMGNLLTFGDNAQGQLGIGNANVTAIGNWVRVDSSGNPFTNIASISAYFAGNANNGWYAIKTDGTMWVVGGNKNLGMALNGTDSTHADTAAYLPTQVPIPGGKLAWKVVGGQHATVLLTDSSVSTGGKVSSNDLGYSMAGTQYQTLHDIGLSHITDICGSGPYNVALDVFGHLWGWGSWGSWLGHSVTSGAGPVISVPTRLIAIEDSIYLDAGSTDTIKHVYANSAAIYYLTKSGKLYVNGDQSQGIGNCVHQNMSDSTPGPPAQFPNAWNSQTNNTPLIYPRRLLSGWTNPIVAVFTNFPFVYYAWFEDSKGNLFSTGRNKGAVLGNGVIGTTSSNQAATYGNAWDDSCTTQIWPFNLLDNIKVPVPWCVLHPNGSPCNEYAIPTHAAPSVTVLNGTNQNVIGATSITLTTFGFPVSPAKISTYLYTFNSGPNNPTIVNQPNFTTLITGLIPGVYSIKVTVTDSDNMITATDITVNVNSAADQLSIPIRKLFK